MAEVSNPNKKIVTGLDIVRYFAEIAALIVLFTHLIPNNEKILEKWKENNVGAMFLLGFCLFFSLLILFIYKFSFEKEKEILNNKYEDSISTFNLEKEKYDKEIFDLRLRAKYADIFPHLNKGYAELNNAIRNGNYNEIQYKQAFQSFCTSLAMLFTEVKGVKCHVCMKLAIACNKKAKLSVSNVKAGTLVRDGISIDREHIDSIPINHLFNQNTDYEYIFKNIQSESAKYFMSNDIVSLDGYKNTSFLAKGDSCSYIFNSTSLAEREEHWPLPYKSLIIVPICPGIQSQRNTTTLLGFIAVDSNEKNVFNDDADKDILSGCADGLYNSLQIFLNNTKTNAHGKTNAQQQAKPHAQAANVAS